LSKAFTVFMVNAYYENREDRRGGGASFARAADALSRTWLRLAIGTVEVGCRRIGSTQRPIVTRIDPQSTGLGATRSEDAIRIGRGICISTVRGVRARA